MADRDAPRWQGTDIGNKGLHCSSPLHPPPIYFPRRRGLLRGPIHGPSLLFGGLVGRDTSSFHAGAHSDYDPGARLEIKQLSLDRVCALIGLLIP